MQKIHCMSGLPPLNVSHALLFGKCVNIVYFCVYFLLANVIRSALRILISFGDKLMSEQDTQQG